jgi:LPS export ABC transporter protein LptC
VDLDRDDFVLSGRVYGSVGPDQSFETSEVRYESQKARLWTDQPVSVKRSRLILKGDGMEIDLASRTLKISGRVHTHLAGDQ